MYRSPVLTASSRRAGAAFIDFQKTTAATRHLATVQDSIATSIPSDPPSVYVSSSARKSRRPPVRSQIRDSLRTWGAQNDRIKAQDVPDTIPHEGKITRLPNALFVNDVDESFQDEAESELDAFEDGAAYAYGDLMRPGTLISYTSTQVNRQYVVYLGDIGQQSLLFLEDGRFAVEKMTQKRATFSRMRYMAVPDFLTPAEVNALIAHMPKQDVMRSLGEGLPSSFVDVTGSLPDHVCVPMRDKVKAWSDEVDAFSRDHKTQLDQLYHTLALPHKWRRIHLADLPPLALGRTFDSMTDAAKMSLISHCSQAHPLFVTVQVASSVDYLLGPKKLDDSINTVFEWARLYQEAAAQAAVGKDVSKLLKDNPLSSFIDKARRIILRSRKIRPPTEFGVLGSSLGVDDSSGLEKVPSGDTFTADDQKIIAYLQDVGVRRPMGANRLSQASLIVRAVGAYPGLELKGNVVRMLLQEIGVLNPWERFLDLSLPVLGGPATEELDGLTDLALQSLSRDDVPLSVALPDTMSHMRKDWGSLQAFCIDSTITRNVEDAISIEPANSQPGAYWIHVHLAHMTALLHPDHPITQLARKRGSAFYSNTGGMTSHTMVPSALIDHCSLRPDARVLTVSTLIDDEGIVHEIKVAPATIRNVVTLDADSVRHVMSDEMDEEAVLVVGNVSLSRHLQTASDENIEVVNRHLPSLKLMQRLFAARLDRRQKEVKTPANVSRPTGAVNIRTDCSAPPRTLEEIESYHWKGDPGVTVRADLRVKLTAKYHQRRAWDVVTQAMRIASESLAKWLVDRNIPAVFIGNDVGPAFSIEKANNHGLNEMISWPPISRTSTRRPLVLQNIQQYVACTSPMRKFIDTITLLQVDSYLKAQAQGLIHQDAAVQDESILAFSKTEIDQHLARDVAPMDMLQKFGKQQDEDWLYQALFRAFHLKQADLPKVMEVLIDTPRCRDAQGKLSNAMGRMLPWGGEVELEPTVQGFENTAKHHSFVPVELVRVDPVGHRILARAVGVPTEEQQYLDPIICCKQSDTGKLEDPHPK